VYSLVINGHQQAIDVQPGTTLITVLRETLGLRGTKLACGRGECGACTVLHGADPIASCVMFVDLVSQPITTIEGLSEPMTELRAAWTDFGGFQCGFCTPGLIVRASVLADADFDSEVRLRQALGGNICRCTGYVGLLNALQSVRANLDQHQLNADDVF
jgi:aerobic-type carbon monoxide dehydrogenase small subunit (CoxS/CutS family)